MECLKSGSIDILLKNLCLYCTTHFVSEGLGMNVAYKCKHTTQTTHTLIKRKILLNIIMQQITAQHLTIQYTRNQ